MRELKKISTYETIGTSNKHFCHQEIGESVLIVQTGELSFLWITWIKNGKITKKPIIGGSNGPPALKKEKKKTITKKIASTE